MGLSSKPLFFAIVHLQTNLVKCSKLEGVHLPTAIDRLGSMTRLPLDVVGISHSLFPESNLDSPSLVASKLIFCASPIYDAPGHVHKVHVVNLHFPCGGFCDRQATRANLASLAPFVKTVFFGSHFLLDFPFFKPLLLRLV